MRRRTFISKSLMGAGVLAATPLIGHTAHQKKLQISGVALAAFFEVTNLFDTENVLWVYSRTGKPFDNGQPGLVGSTPDANYNPANVGPPRTMTLGLQFIW